MAAVPPGEFLRGVLEGLSMSQSDLARRTGFSQKHVNFLAQGKSNITASGAIKLEYVTGVPAIDWLTIRNEYLLEKARAKQEG